MTKVKMSLSNSRLFDPNLNNRTTFGTAGPAGPPGPIGPPGPGASPMTPSIEGTAFGTTDMLGRTQLGYQVDNSSSNNIGLWSSSTGAPQETTNSTSSVTAFVDTPMLGAQMQNGVYLGETSNITGSNLSNSIMLARASDLVNQTDWTENIMLLNGFTANPNDSVTRSLAMISGQFVTDTAVNEGILLGDMTNTFGGTVDNVICVRTRGGIGTVGLADGCCYIGTGDNSILSAAGDCIIADYQRFFLRMLRNDNTSGEIVYYDSGSGELTYGPEPGVYVLPAKKPTILGGQYGISNSGNANEVNGLNCFDNYSTSPPQLVSVTAVGSGLYQGSIPANNSFLSCIFMGRSHQFTGASIVRDSMILANIIGTPGITSVTEANILCSRSGSVTLGYAGALTGCNFVSSGSINCLGDPLDSVVFSSAGTVNPGSSNLVLCENRTGGSVVMAGAGNTLITSSSTAVSYSWPAGVSNATVIKAGINAIIPTANGQLAVNHTGFLFPNLPSATAANSTFPVGFSQATGQISYYSSTDYSRVLRRVGNTNASGQIVFSTGVITPLANSAVSLTVRDASTTIAYTAQVIAIGASSVTVQVFQSTNAMVGPTMVPAGAGITVHMNMSY